MDRERRNGLQYGRKRENYRTGGKFERIGRENKAGGTDERGKVLYGSFRNDIIRVNYILRKGTDHEQEL